MYEKITYYIVIKGLLTSTQFERKTYKFCTGRVTSGRIKSMMIRNLEREVEMRESHKQRKIAEINYLCLHSTILHVSVFVKDDVINMTRAWNKEPPPPPRPPKLALKFRDKALCNAYLQHSAPRFDFYQGLYHFS